MGHHHDHEHCHAHILPEKWKNIFPRAFIGWGSIQAISGLAIGSTAVASNGFHDIADGISLKPQAENVDGSVNDHHEKHSNRELANNILFGLGALAVTKAGIDVWGPELPEADLASSIKNGLFIGLAGISFTINSLAAKEPFTRIVRKKEKIEDIDEKKLLGHLAIDIGASAGALTSSILTAKGMLPHSDAVVGAGIGLVTMAGYRPSWLKKLFSKNS